MEDQEIGTDTNNTGIGENSRFGNYQIVKPIGKGKFAVVFRAKHIDTDEVVALKRINVDLIDNKTRDKCLKEVKLLQSLDHPNIIRYLDSFITENDLVIVVEWAAAGDLKRQLRKQSEKEVGFEERIIWKYFSQICDAIQHMHQRRIMHRDLKPANIFLTLDGIIKVGDLGLSRELSEHTIQAHSKVGTPLYMSPEVLRGDGYDFKSDIWSLGCLLYELAMLKSPFKSEGLKLYALFQKIAQGDYQPLPNTYSDTLRNLTHSLLLTKPEDRPDINNICNIAREMRASTQEVYLKLKKQASDGKLMRQDSDYSNQGSPPREQTKVPYSTPPKQGRRPSAIGERVEDAPSKTASVRKIKEPSNESHKSRLVKHLGFDDLGTPNAQYEEKLDPKGRLFGNDKTSPEEETEDLRQQMKSYRHQVPFASPSNHSDYGTAEEKTLIQGSENSKGFSPIDTQNGQFSPIGRHVTQASPTEVIIRDDSGRNSVDKPEKPKSYHRPKTRGQPSSSMSPVVSVPAKLNPSANMDILEQGANDEDSPVLNNKTAKKNSDSNTKIQKLSSAITLMDALFCKLQLLGYVKEDPTLLPFYFAVDLSAYSRIAGFTSGEIKQQYRKFVIISMWIIEKICSSGNLQSKQINSINSKIKNISVDKDSPVMVCKQILAASQDSGVSAENLQDITPTVLSTGYGEKVCSLLLCLADIALKTFELKQLVYIDSSFNTLEGAEEVEEADENEIAELIDENQSDHEFELMRADSSTLDEGFKSIILPSVDPSLWREEYERVQSTLAKESIAQKAKLINWKSRINDLSSYSNCSRTMSSGDTKDKQQLGEVASILSLLSKDISATLTGIRRSEDVVNLSSQFLSLGQDFCRNKKILDTLKGQIASTSKSIEALTETNNDLSDKIDVLKSELDARMSDDSANSNSRALKVREAINTIKHDIQSLDLSLGLVSNQLMSRKHEEMHNKLAATAEKRKMRQLNKYEKNSRKNINRDVDSI